MQRRITRRQFLRSSAAAAGAGLVILSNPASARTFAANERVNVALVGVSGRGSWFVQTMPGLSNVVAMCDVNEYRARNAFEQFPDLPKFSDYRVMLDRMDREIDAITVAVPDNTHAIIAGEGVRRGKGVLCEKPLSHDVWESRRLRELAAEHKVATQMGNQGTSSEAFRRGVELIQAGVLGPVREAYAWATSRGSGKAPVIGQEQVEVPDTLNWDVWLGPAKERAYHPVWMQWAGWRELGTGALGNWGSHSANMVFKGLRIDSLWYADPATAPRIRFTGEVAAIEPDRFPEWERVRYEVPARGDMPPVTVHWINGPTAPGAKETLESLAGDLDWGDKKEKKWADHAGCIVTGPEGTIQATSHNMSFNLLPREKFEGFGGPPQTLPRSTGHEREWLEAVKGGPQPMSHFGYSGPLNEFLQLGNIAAQMPGVTLEYDPLVGRITNNAQADAMLRREYRSGWSL